MIVRTKVILKGAIAFATCFMATAVLAVGPQYVGPSGTARDGETGYFTFHRDCAAAYRGATMCTQQMIIENGPSGKAPNPSLDGEWVNPNFIPHDGTNFRDLSGSNSNQYPYYFNCDGWWYNGSDLQGLIVTSDTSDPETPVVFVKANCNLLKSAACCK